VSLFEHTIEVDVPVRVAYDQWTLFKEYPEFMDGVDSVELVDRITLSWVATIFGRRRAWKARIVERTPDVRVAWRSINGAINDGTVLFHSLGLDRTLVTLRLEMEPDGPVEDPATARAFVERRVRGDLRRFKKFVEDRLVPTGAWRGQAHPARVART
jgi:uncharacterized membrane protein